MPIIVQGDVVDDLGRPSKGATVTLAVNDWEAAALVVPRIWEVTTTTDAEGRFVFRGLPPPEVLAFVDGGAFVNMDLSAFHDERRLVGGWAFPRALDGATWAGEPETVHISLIGP
jgi:hypothetical protein